MALPKIATPVFMAVLPSNKMQIKYRPFLVKEEKALLLAKQQESAPGLMLAVWEVINACTFGVLDIKTLAMIDLEFLFLRIQAKSVGEEQKVSFPCTVTEGCSGSVIKTINTETDIVPISNPQHTSKIAITDTVGIVMRYPTMQGNIDRLTSENFDEIDMLIDCIDYIYDKDETFPASEQTREELSDFLQTMTDEQFGRLQGFFETMPYMGFNLKFKCPVCEQDNEIELRGIESFF